MQRFLESAIAAVMHGQSKGAGFMYNWIIWPVSVFVLRVAIVVQTIVALFKKKR